MKVGVWFSFYALILGRNTDGMKNLDYIRGLPTSDSKRWGCPFHRGEDKCSTVVSQDFNS